MNYYCLIPSSDITQAQINYSRSNSTNEMSVYVSTEYLLGVFPLLTQFYIVEFPIKSSEYTDAFDNYKWYKADEIREILENI